MVRFPWIHPSLSNFGHTFSFILLLSVLHPLLILLSWSRVREDDLQLKLTLSDEVTSSSPINILDHTAAHCYRQVLFDLLEEKKKPVAEHHR